MNIKELYEINKTTIYNKFNFLMAFSLLEFFMILFLGFVILAAIINSIALFVIGLIVFCIGVILVSAKYIWERIKIKKLDEVEVEEEIEAEVEKTEEEPKKRILI